eukprot:scaffold201770_cov40-Prasinocladus_malaysianus.AAC.1
MSCAAVSSLVSPAMQLQPSLSDCRDLVGRAVRKFFPPNPETQFPGGWFKGQVETFEKDVVDEAGVHHNGPFFSVV